MDFVKLIIADVPLFPVGFTEGKYLPGRIERNGLHRKLKATTQDAWLSVDRPNRREKKPIQNVVYNKYKIEVITKENINLDIIQDAETLQIQYNDSGTEETFDIEILTVTGPDQISETYNYKYLIEFIFLNDDNYTVANYLTSDKLLNKPYADQLVELNLKNNYNRYSQRTASVLGYINFDVNDETDSLIVGDVITVEDPYNVNANLPSNGVVTAKTENIITCYLSYHSSISSQEFILYWAKTNAISLQFYTKLLPEDYDFSEADSPEPIKIDGMEVRTKDIGYDVAKIKFYLSYEEYRLFKRNINKCSTVYVLDKLNGVYYYSHDGYPIEYKDDTSTDLYGVIPIELNLSRNKLSFIHE